jgi:carboxylesterase type B
VKDNIHLFGGDPDNITIFGESDGATGVGLQLTAYGGKHGAPFHRAIMQSGAATTDTGANSNISATAYAAVAALTNCTHSGPGSAETLACLRNLPLETLLNATFTYAIAKDPPFGFSVYFPVVDQDFIPAAPSQLLQTGQFSKHISVVNGWTTDDGSLFTPTTVTDDSTVTAFLITNFPGFTTSTIARILALYPVSDFESEVLPDDTVNAHFYRASRIFRESKFTCPCIDLSYNVMKYSNAKARLYQLNQTVFTSLFSSIGSAYLGVSHASDIPYVYNEVTSYSNSSSDKLLAAQITGNWSAFAATGMPTDATAWPVAYSRVDYFSPTPQKAVVNILGGPYAGPTKISIDSQEGPLGMEKILLRCAFWISIYDELRT